MTVKENVNVTALLAGVTTLVTTVGALTATGILGRLQRNEPDAVIAAVVLVLLGGMMSVLGGLPVTRGRAETFANVLGAGLIVVGIGWALAAGVVVTGQRESPQVTASFAADGARISGAVKAGNLASDRQMVVLVEGLRAIDAGTQKWEVVTLAQYYVGPDGDGKIDLPYTVDVAAKRYDAVGIKAWTDDEDTCGKYPRRVANEPFKKQVDVAGTGCVVLPMPPAVARPLPKAPPATTTKATPRPKPKAKRTASVRPAAYSANPPENDERPAIAGRSAFWGAPACNGRATHGRGAGGWVVAASVCDGRATHGRGAGGWVVAASVRPAAYSANPPAPSSSAG